MSRRPWVRRSPAQRIFVRASSCRSVPPRDPFLKVWSFSPDRRRIAVAGPDYCFRRERQEPVPEGFDDGGEVAEGTSRCSRSALEQRVAAEHGALRPGAIALEEEAHGPGRVAGGVQRDEPG